MTASVRFTDSQPMQKALKLAKFAPPRKALTELEFEIVSELFKVGAAAYREDVGDREWTREILDTLEKMAIGKGLLPFPNKLKDRWNRGGEWLFDHVWCDVGAVKDPKKMDWRETQSLHLAVECEWSIGEYDLLSDFMKLTMVQADYRLFIYTNTPIHTSDRPKAEPADECYRRCPKDRGFRYLLIGFPNELKGTFRVDAWTI